MAVMRSVFYVPGNNEKMVAKAPEFPADIITLDLDFDDRCLDGLYANLRKNSTPRLSADIKGEALVWSFGPDGKVNPKASVGVT